MKTAGDTATSSNGTRSRVDGVLVISWCSVMQAVVDMSFLDNWGGSCPHLG